MTIVGFIACIITLGLGVALLVIAKNDVVVTILGLVSAILGATWAGFYYAMLMGW